ncbi:hypothetical protein chiPu_0024855 [Chiloscyllium punctatum]|uniref:Uncharacterized protein n=1 Tax=Chiloscyllium punctatum TaxID=137246 RepID=A0A401TE82_CHIPU|nr:hypothetical protein [Chiloscyllium punctatum]
MRRPCLRTVPRDGPVGFRGAIPTPRVRLHRPGAKRGAVSPGRLSRSGAGREASWARPAEWLCLAWASRRLEAKGGGAERSPQTLTMERPGRLASIKDGRRPPVSTGLVAPLPGRRRHFRPSDFRRGALKKIQDGRRRRRRSRGRDRRRGGGPGRRGGSSGHGRGSAGRAEEEK